jgi:hypothetical protein
LKPLSLEVVPDNLILFEQNYFIQTGGFLLGDVVIPHVKPQNETPNYMPIFMRRLDPIHGFVQSHFVLEATLANGKKYIVSPGSMEYSYRGPNGCLIAHGESDDFKKNFPGKVLGELDGPSVYKDLRESGLPIGNKMDFGPIYDELYLRGNRRNNNVERLLNSVIKFYDNRICSYCGWIEGEHHVAPNPDCRYRFRPVILQLCGRCGQAAYCGKECQKADWKWHKECCKGTKK